MIDIFGSLAPVGWQWWEKRENGVKGKKDEEIKTFQLFSKVLILFHLYWVNLNWIHLVAIDFSFFFFFFLLLMEA